MRPFISCAAFATHATCAKPELPRQAQPPCSRRCEGPGPLCGSRQMKQVLASASSSEPAGAADAAISTSVLIERQTGRARHSEEGLETGYSCAARTAGGVRSKARIILQALGESHHSAQQQNKFAGYRDQDCQATLLATMPGAPYTRARGAEARNKTSGAPTAGDSAQNGIYIPSTLQPLLKCTER